MRNPRMIGLVAVLTVLLTLVAAPTSAGEPERAVDRVLVEHAQRFREGFGFESSLEFVAGTFADVRLSSSEWVFH